MNDDKFNANYETSRQLGSVTERFGSDLMFLARNTCRARLVGVPNWKIDIVTSDGLMKCLELFDGLNRKLQNPIDYFHTMVDNLAIDFLKEVYVDGNKDAFGCSLYINQSNGREGGKSLVAKQINDNNEFNY